MAKNLEFNPWVGKIPWRRKWLPTLVFLPGKSHGQKSLVGVHGVAKCWTQLKPFSMHARNHPSGEKYLLSELIYPVGIGPGIHDGFKGTLN